MGCDRHPCARGRHDPYTLAAPSREWLQRAKVDLEIRKAPPDTVWCEMLTPDRKGSQGNVLYVRIRATHQRGNSALNVLLTATRLWRLDEDGRREIVETFLPSELNWSH